MTYYQMVNIGNTIIGKLADVGIYARIGKYSNDEVVLVETYKHFIAIYPFNEMEIRTNKGEYVKRYKSINGIVNRIIKIVDGNI